MSLSLRKGEREQGRKGEGACKAPARPLALSAFLLTALLALAACDGTEIDPVIDTGRPFTLWGALDPRSDYQGLRVVPIRLQLDAEEGGPADAVVTVEDLDAGETITLRDSLVRFENGLTGTVYVGDFRPTYEGRYRVTATRPDGAASVAVVEVPPLTEPVVFLPEVVPGQVYESVLWPEAPRVNAVEVTYRVRGADCRPNDVTFVLEEHQVVPAKIGWEARLPLTAHREAVSDQLGVSELTLGTITVRGLVTDAAWKPPFGFTFDSEVIIEPSTLTNVENGFGYVGAGYPTEVTWRLDDEDLQDIGYRPSDFFICN